MAESGFEGGFQPGLVGVEFPGVDVKHEGLVLFCVDSVQQAGRKAKRVEAKIPAAGDGKIEFSESSRFTTHFRSYSRNSF